MNLQLPESIKTYFQASKSYDRNLLVNCFAKDAILYDEGLTYHGSTAIADHISQANTDFQVKTEVVNVEEKDKEVIVTAILSGNFNGSPVTLDYYFTMDEKKIASLRIV
ncbi:nuclear transport factor 2 family protein [Fusibacter bizertensis]